MQTSIATILLLLLAGISFSQVPEKLSKQMGPFPVLFLDSVEVKMDTMRQLVISPQAD